MAYEDWEPSDWTVSTLVGELADNCPTRELDDARVTIFAPDGRELQVTAIYRDTTGLRVMLGEAAAPADGRKATEIARGGAGTGAAGPASHS